MGWDAFSTAKYNWDKERFVDPAHGRAFKAAVKFVTVTVDVYVDSGLKRGLLDLSGCGEMLKRATGESVYGPPWSPDLVRTLNERADWNFTPQDKYLESDICHYWSAFIFLDTCARLGLGIRFSW